MIKEQFVSFDTAKLLKEAGFNVPCSGVYVTDRTGYCEFREYENKQTTDDLCWNTEDGFQYEYLAPTQALAARWLREVHGIHVSSNIFMDSANDADGNTVDEWIFWSYDLFDNSGRIIEESDDRYDNYEEAMEAGLQEALELIKNRSYERDTKEAD